MADVALVDVSLRDGNQSLWGAAGLRTAHVLQVAPLLERVFSRDVLRIPLRGERVAVAKTPVITGEVAVSKASGSEVERVETTVRRLEVEVEASEQLVREDVETGTVRRDDVGRQ